MNGTFTQVALMVFTLLGLAVPFLRITHARHARAFMVALVGLTALWTVLYEIARWHFLGNHAPDHVDIVLLRGYIFSAAICVLLEECLSYRDVKKQVRPMLLILSLFFMAIALFSFVSGVFTL